MDEKTVKNINNLMTGMGNISYLWGHVDYFEKNVPDEIAPFIELGGALNVENWAYQECHNFSAWLRLYVELICNKAMIRFSHFSEGRIGPTEEDYAKSLEAIGERAFKTAREKRLSEQRCKVWNKSLKLVFQLRHSLQHGGIPRQIRRDKKFGGIKPQEVAEMAIPQNFSRTKKTFEKANLLLEKLLPTKTIVIHKNGEMEFQTPLGPEVTRGILKDLHERFGPEIPKRELTKAVDKARREIEARESCHNQPGTGRAGGPKKKPGTESRRRPR